MKIEEIRKYFEECHDKSDGNDCDEGNYYCDECAIKRIKANT